MILLLLLLSLVFLYGSNLQASVQKHLYEPVTPPKFRDIVINIIFLSASSNKDLASTGLNRRFICPNYCCPHLGGPF